MHIIYDAFLLGIALNPISLIAFLLGEMGNIPIKTKIKFVTTELIAALIILIIFSVFGSSLLLTIGITETAIRLGGSIVLSVRAYNLLFKINPNNSKSHKVQMPFIVPVATPMLVGPTAMSMAIAIGCSGSHPLESISAICGAWGIVSFIVLSVIILIDSMTRGSSDSNGIALAFIKIAGMLISFVASSMFIKAIRMIIISSMKP